MCTIGANSPAPGHGAEAAHADTPPELIFPPQYPFSWTLRGARAQRLRAKRTPAITTTSYRITGSARNEAELTAALAFCEEHGARLEMD
jgi:hypothetical protein